MDEPSPTKENGTSQTIFATPKVGRRSTRMSQESRSNMQYSTPVKTPSKRLSYLPLEVASTTPKPLKGAKKSSRLAILPASPQEIHVSGKDIQKSVKAKCPTLDTHRLKSKGRMSIGPRESLLVECPPESPTVEKKVDILFRMKNDKTPLVAKQIDTSF